MTTSLSSAVFIVVAGLLVSSCASTTGIDLERVNPPTLNKHPVYAQLTTVSGAMQFVFVAGQVDRPLGYEPRSNECAHSDWRSQYIGTMDNVTKALEAAGATWADVVFIRKFTTDMEKYLALSNLDLPDYWRPGEAPSSTLVEVVKLSEPCQLIEIDVIAVVAER